VPDYYVTHPNIDYSAVVDAPTTEKARTVFLDYLERTGRLNRRLRQQARADMVAERLEDAGSVSADVRLSYYYGGNGREYDMELEDMPREQVDRDSASFDRIYHQYETGRYVRSQIGEGEMSDIDEEDEEEEAVPVRSPISEVSLGGSV